MGLAGRRVKDPVWLYILSRQLAPCVLISFDNKMPTRHRADLIRRKSTVAYVDSKAPRAGRNREQYTREVIHKWHRMANQAPGTLYKYRLNGRTLFLFRQPLLV
jgi:hypothetical protein